MARRGAAKDYDEPRKTKILYDVIDGTDPPLFAELVRKLGLNEQTVHQKLKRNKPDCFGALNVWCLKAGGIDNDSLEKLLELVEQELDEDCRSLEVDDIFRNLNECDIVKGRNLAWFIYDFLRERADEDWDRFARVMLKLPNHRTAAIRKDFADDSTEQKYREMWRWKLMKKIDTVDEMVCKLKEVGAVIPRRYDFVTTQAPHGDQQNGSQENNGGEQGGPAATEVAGTQTDNAEVESAIVQAHRSSGSATREDDLAGVDQHFSTLGLQPDSGVNLDYAASNRTFVKEVVLCKTPKIIMSYSQTQDGRDISDVPRKIAKELEMLGYIVTCDVENEATVDSVKDCDVIIVGMSETYEKESVESKPELEMARALKKKIVPVKVVEDYRPGGWFEKQNLPKMFYDFTEFDFESEFQRLVKDIRGESSGPKKDLLC